QRDRLVTRQAKHPGEDVGQVESSARNESNPGNVLPASQGLLDDPVTQGRRLEKYRFPGFPDRSTRWIYHRSSIGHCLVGRLKARLRISLSCEVTESG